MLSLPLCFDSQSAAPLIRKALEDLDYRFERSTDKGFANRYILVAPIPTGYYIFRFTVFARGEEKIKSFDILLYDMPVTQTIFIPHIDINGIDEENIGNLKEVLQEFIKKLPRKPWEFSISQRFLIGFLNMDVLRAKRAWSKALDQTF